MTEALSAAKTDITNRTDIERLVNEFYGRVRQDELIGFIFDKVAEVDWESHLPKMYAFWETILFGTGNFRGNPMVAHARLVPLTEMGRPQFSRWLTLFQQTVNDLFEGEHASRIKYNAENIAQMLHARINNVADPRFDPANLTPDQRERYRRYQEGNAETESAG